MHVKRAIKLNDDARVKINDTFHSLIQDGKGYKNLPCFEQDIRNYINNKRRAIGKE